MKMLNKYAALLMASFSLNVAFVTATCSYVEGQYKGIYVDDGTVLSHLGTTHYLRFKPCDKTATSRVGISVREKGSDIREHYFIIIEPVTLIDRTAFDYQYYSLENAPVRVTHSEYSTTTNELLWRREVNTTVEFLGLKGFPNWTGLSWGNLSVNIPAGEGRKGRNITVYLGIK